MKGKKKVSVGKKAHVKKVHHRKRHHKGGGKKSLIKA